MRSLLTPATYGLWLSLAVFALGPLGCDSGGGGATRTDGTSTVTATADARDDVDATDASEGSDLADSDAVEPCVPGEGECPAVGAPIPGDWTLLQPRWVVQPGTRLELEVTGIDVSPDQIVVWRDDGEWVPPRAVWVAEEGGDLETMADDVVTVEIFVPYVTAGPHTFALGTDAAGRRSGDAAIEVVFPSALPSQVEVAATLRDGVIAWTATVGELLESSDPGMRAWVDATWTPAERQEMADVVAVIEEIAQIAHADYLALTDEEHRIAATLLVNTGALDDFSGAAYGVGSGGTGVVLLGDVVYHPIHKALFEIDFTVMALNVADGVLNAVEVIAIATGAGAPVGVAIGGFDIALTVLRIFIDTYLPTDLAALEIVAQSAVLEDEGVNTTMWGTFETEKPGLTGSFEAIITLSFKAAVSDLSGFGKSAKVTEILQGLGDLVAQIIGRVSPDLATLFDAELTLSRVRLKTLVNVYPYGLTLSDFATVIPVLGDALRLITIFVDIVFVSPVDFAEGSAIPGWAEGLELSYGYDADLLAVTNVPSFPDGVTEFPLQIQVSAYAWKAVPPAGWTRYLPIDVPSRADVIEVFATTVRDRATVENVADEDFVITEVQLEDGTVRDGLILPFDGGVIDRSYEVLFFERNLNALGDPTTKVRVEVNGEVVAESVELFDNGTPVPLELALQPMRNTVTLTVVDGRDFATTPVISAGHFGFALPAGATQTNRDLDLDIGQSATLVIWAPPEPPSGR